MKARLGYVSNSSSSSFLVCYRDEGVFRKLRDFRGCEPLLNDLRNCGGDGSAREIMIDFIKRELFGNMDGYSNAARGISRDFIDGSENFRWWEICYEVGYDDKAMPEMRSMIHELGRKMLDSLGGRKVHYDDPVLVRFRDDCEKVMEGASRAVDGLLSSEQARGWTFRGVEYEDEREFGSYMEHGFMPFLERYPDGGMAVYGLSNH